ncbi:hypothetical protein ACFC1R_37540 [Kitasatospora sp. NPDC056138]|uniref:hypothetical protein n=1 Tax=Kitasatospora sp. NPDC056138 TaxID=3345724 RepID=UPI0035D63EEC
MSTIEQIPAAQALMAIVATCGDLPTPELAIRNLVFNGLDDKPTVEWGVEISLHSGLPHFEQWRDALSFDPADVDHAERHDLGWLTVTARYAGIPVRLIGYYDPYSDQEQAS